MSVKAGQDHRGKCFAAQPARDTPPAYAHLPKEGYMAHCIAIFVKVFQGAQRACGAAFRPIVLAATTSACAYNPILDREQFILVPDAQIASMASDSWSAIEAETPGTTDRGQIARVEQVGGRLLLALGEHRSDWTFKVFDDSSLNAFALPGGKVGINSGMVAFCRSDDELASVIGHEIAHVKLRHSAERVSQQLAMQGAIDIVTPDDATMAALLGAGASLGVILPFSRKHELEADRLGLRYIAVAGYDPMAAVELWSRMAKQTGRAQQPAWLSTHPADAARIEALRAEARRLSAASS